MESAQAVLAFSGAALQGIVGTLSRAAASALRSVVARRFAQCCRVSWDSSGTMMSFVTPFFGGVPYIYFLVKTWHWRGVILKFS